MVKMLPTNIFRNGKINTYPEASPYIESDVDSTSKDTNYVYDSDLLTG